MDKGVRALLPQLLTQCFHQRDQHLGLDLYLFDRRNLHMLSSSFESSYSLQTHTDTSCPIENFRSSRSRNRAAMRGHEWLGRLALIGGRHFTVARPTVLRTVIFAFQGVMQPKNQMERPLSLSMRISPFFITSATFRSALMLAVGSPSTRSKSANCPGAIIPSLSAPRC